jgi:serine/threonine protein kinase/WD40 repeat protein
MDDPAPPKHCPQCGSPVAMGVSVVLCPVCVLTEDPAGEIPEETSPRQVGTYTLLEEIARGGMGVVYRARQNGLNRIVALKVLPGAAFASASFRARFQREAETAARLKHPGIVAVHEVGLALGQPFLSMDFIDGPSLAARLAESRMTPEFAAQILREVARAVEHAHHHGVAHRDLKPSNILLTRDNHPVLTDFGLACFLDLESLEGMTLDVMGSPPYLPPERVASGKSGDPVMEDVYGLGAVLYHCLTGRPPFVADSIQALLSAVTDSEPVAPRRLNHSVPADLETICLKCLQKSPSARYVGASEVADELDRFLRGEPIIARPLAAMDHLLRLIRGKPLISFLILALAATILAGTVASLLGWRSAASSAADYRATAEKRRIDLYSANLSAASAAMESGNRNQAKELLARCRPASGESDLRGCEWYVLEQLLQRREWFSARAHDHILTALAWHPSGESLLSAGHDGSLKSWKQTGVHDLLEDREIVPPGNPRIRQIQWLDNGSAFLAAEGDFIRCRRVGETRPLWEIAGCGFSLTPDGRTLAVTTGGWFFYEPPGTISLYQTDPDNSRKPTLQRKLPFSARAVAISPDGRWLAAGLPRHGHHDEERDLDLFDLTGPDAAPRHLETSGAILSLGFSPDSSRLVATTQTGKPHIHGFDVVTGTQLELRSSHTARVWSAVFTADSQSLLTTSSDRSLSFSSMDGAPPKVLPLAHDNEIWSSAIHPSGTRIATGDKDGMLKIHSLPLPAAPLVAFPRHPHFRYAVPVFSPDSTVLYACETSPAWKTVAWKPGAAGTQPTPFMIYPLCMDSMGNAAWRDTQSRQIIYLGPSRQPAEMAIPAESWPETPSLQNHGSSADGRHLYQFSESGHAATIELATGNIRTTAEFCRDQPTASAISPGGRFLVAATWQELVIHDFHSATTTRRSNDPHWAKTLVFSPDGGWLASGGNDGHILLRRLPDFAMVWKLSGHLSEVSGLAVSPDGRTLVSSEIGSGLRFWRLDTMREVMRLPLADVCESLVFSPDGQSLAVTTCPPARPPTDGQVLVIPCPRAGAE